MTAPSRPMQGILWMIATGLCFIAVTAIVKQSAKGLPAAEAAFLRYLLGLVFLLPLARSLFSARLSRRGDRALRGAGGCCIRWR